MIEIDLITGPLGSGKTTFIKKYATFLTSHGNRIGIIENDFGAVNVDLMMLQDLPEELVEREQVIGGNTLSDWTRRFRTKLISMAMRGFQRILVEPSGIYDVDTFLDILREEPLDSWYRIGNIFTVLDVRYCGQLSEPEESLLVSQLAPAGKLLLNKIADPADIIPALEQINGYLAKYACPRQFVLPECSTEATSPQDIVFTKSWELLTEQDFYRLQESGWTPGDHKKLWFDQKDAFSALFYMHPSLPAALVPDTVRALFLDPACGKIARIKGFLPNEDSEWMQLNATREHLSIANSPQGQDIVIVIGQKLCDQAIRRYWYPGTSS